MGEHYVSGYEIVMGEHYVSGYGIVMGEHSNVIVNIMWVVIT